jgi:hypothetical protein
MFYLGILYGLGYIFYSSISFQSNYQKKFYYKLFDKQTFVIHLLVTFLIAWFGFYRCKQGYFRETFFIAPFLFLLTLRLFDLLSLTINKRHVIIATRYDDRPKYYRWYTDGILSIVIVALPIVTCGHLMNKFKIGQFFI